MAREAIAAFDAYEARLDNAAETHKRVENLGTEDAHHIGADISRSVGSFFFTEPRRSDASVEVAGLYASRPEVFPPNSVETRTLIGSLDRLSDSRIRMSDSDISAAVQGAHEVFDRSVARFEGHMQQQLQAMLMQIQSISAAGKMTEELEKLKEKIKELLEKTEKKSSTKEEEEKAADLESRVQKEAFKILESALEEIGAPKQLIAAIKREGELVNKAARRLLLRLGLNFLSSKDALSDPQSKEQVGKAAEALMGTAKKSAAPEQVRQALTSVSAFIRAAEAKGKAVAQGMARALEERTGLLKKAVEFLEQAEKHETNEAVKKAYADLRGQLTKLLDAMRQKDGLQKTDQQFTRVMGAIAYARSAFEKLLHTPESTDSQKKEKAALGTLFANAIRSAIEDPVSEKTKMLQGLADTFMRSVDPDLKARISGWSDALFRNKKVDEVKTEICSFLSKKAESVLGMIAEPKIKEALGAFLGILKEPKKAGAEDILRASNALALGERFARDVSPKAQKDDKVKDAAAKFFSRAMEALRLGAHDDASFQIDLAKKYVDAPPKEREDAEKLSLRVRSSTLTARAGTTEGGMEQVQRDRVRSDLQRERADLPGLVLRAPKALQGQVTNLIGSIDKVLRRLEDPAESQGVSEDEVKLLSGRIVALKKVMEDMRKVGTAGIGNSLATAYDSALTALAQGDLAGYNMLMLSASELKATQGSDRVSTSFRKAVMDGIGAFNAAKTPEERTAALAKIGKTISQALCAGLDRIAKGQDEETAKKFAAIKARISADDVSAENLNRARQAIGIGDSVGSALRAYRPSRGELIDETKKAVSGILQRALDLLATDGDASAASTQGFIAQKYLQMPPGAHRDEIEALSKRIAINPEAAGDIQTYITVNDKAAMIRKQMEGLPKNSPALAALERIAAELERVKAAIANGQELITKEQVDARVPYVNEMYARGGRIRTLINEEAGKILSAAKERGEEMTPEDAFKLAIYSCAAETERAAEKERVMGLVALSDVVQKGGRNPDKRLVEIVAHSTSAYMVRDIDGGKILLDAASIYQSYPDRRGREEAYAIAQGFDANKLDIRTASFMLGILSEERAGLESAVKDKTLLRNSTAYLDLSLIAARNGDMEGAALFRRMGFSYLRLAGADPANLTKEEREKRAAAMADIEKRMGDYRKNPDIAGGKRLLDIGAEGRAGWEPKPGSITNAAASAALAKKPLREGLGADFEAAESASIDVSSSSQMLAGAAGLNVLSGISATENARRDAGWRAESARLTGLADAARARKDETLAEYYDGEARRTDRTFVTESAGRAKKFLTQGADEAAVADRLEARAAKASAESAAAEKAGDRRNAAALGEEAAKLRGEAQLHRSASADFMLRAEEIRKDLDALDASVRTVNTLGRESGRLALGIAVKTNVALGEGYDVDAMGEPLVRLEADENGEAKAVPASGLTARRGQELSAQAEDASKAGRGAVLEQQNIMRTRNAGLANAKAQLHDFNISKAGELIGKMLSGLPKARWVEIIQTYTGLAASDEEKANPDLFLRRVFSGNADKSLPAASMEGLKKLYFGLANMTGAKLTFTDEKGDTKTAFDPEENEKAYRAASGLWWSENFGGASAFTRSARLSMQSGAFIAGVYVDARALREDIARSSGPKGSGFVVGSHGPHGMGFIDTGDYNLLKQMIAHMPESEQAELLADLERCGNESSGQLARELLFGRMGLYGRSLAQTIIDGGLIYYDEKSLVASAVDARAKAARGDISQAERDLAAVEKKADNDYSQQQMDNQRVSHDYAEFDYIKRSYTEPEKMLPELPEAEGEDDEKAQRGRASVQGVRDELKPSTEAYRKALKKRARENADASGATLKARQAIARSGRMRLNGAAIYGVLSGVEDLDKGLSARLQAASGLEGAERDAMLGEIWEDVVKNKPALLMMAVGGAKRDSSFTPDEIAQLTAIAGSNLVRTQNRDWDLNVAPEAKKRMEKERKFRMDRLATRDKEERRKLGEMADDARVSSIGMSEHGYGFTEDPVRVAAVIKHDHEDNQRDWNMIFSRSVEDKYTTERPGEAGYRAETKEFAESLANQETDLQYLMAGYRRTADNKLEKVDMTPEEYTRVAEAYNQFMILKGNLQTRLASTDAALAWGAEKGYIKTVAGRMDGFYQSAQIVTQGTEEERREAIEKRHLAVAESKQKYDRAEPVGRDGIDLNYRTRMYSDDMANVQAGVDVGVAVVKTAGYGVAFAVGGPVAWVAGGAGAVEGAIGAYDYYDSCGGDLSMMTTGETAYLIFQGAMAAGSAVAPFLGEARTAAAGVEGTVEAVAVGRGTLPIGTRLLESGKTGFGYLMILGGAAQSTIGIMDISEADSSQMPTWAKFANAALMGLQGGVQPGLHVLRGRQAARTGLPAIRGRGQQIGEMLLFGTPLDDAHAIRAQYAEGLERAAVNNELGRLGIQDRAAFADYAQARRASSPGEQLDIVVRYEQARSANKDITFKDFTGMNDRFDNARKVKPDLRFEDFALGEVKMNAEELRARSKAAQEAKKSSEEGASIPDLRRQAADLQKKADYLPRERAGEAVDLIRRANAYEKEADRRRVEVEQGLRSEYSSNAITHGSGAQTVYSVGITGVTGYGPKHMKVATELAAVGEQVSSGQMSIDEAAGRLRANLKARGIEIDHKQSVDAVMSLFVGRENRFSSGNTLGKYEDTRMEGRRMQLEVALEVAAQKLPGMEEQVRLAEEPRAAVAEAAPKAAEAGGEGHAVPAQHVIEGAKPGELLRIQPEAEAVPRAMAVGAEEMAGAPEAREAPKLRLVPRPEGEAGAGPAAKEKGPKAPDAETIAKYEHDIEGFTHPEQVAERIAIEREMGQDTEVLRIAEAKLGLRGDISRTEANAILEQWEKAGDARAKIVDRLVSDNQFTEHMDPVQRALFAQARKALGPDAQPSKVMDAYFGLRARREQLPETAEGLAAMDRSHEHAPDSDKLVAGMKSAAKEDYAKALELRAQADGMSGAQREQVLIRAEELEARAGRLSRTNAALTALKEESTGPGRARVLAEFETARRAALHSEAAGRARDRMTPEQVAIEERQAIDAYAKSKGISPEILAEVYENGGTAGRLAVLDAMGMGTPFEAERNQIAAARKRLDAIADTPANAAGRQELSTRIRELENRYNAMVSGLFEMGVMGDLGGRISQLKGFEGAAVKDITFHGGMRGIYRIEFTDGRRLLVKTEDLSPAQFGLRRVRNEGLISSEIHQGGEYKRHYKDPDTGHTISETRRVGFMEDIHDLAGTEQTARLADGSVKQGTVEGVALFRDEVLKPPADPGAGASPEQKRAYDKAMKAYLENPVVREFWKAASTPEGREEIFKAWRAYHEMSRRAGLMDRHTRNTALVLFRDSEGTLHITFQPFDMDGVGARIFTKAGSDRLDLSLFNNDFGQASAGMLAQFAEGMKNAASLMIPENAPSSKLPPGKNVPLSERPPGIDQLYSEFFSPAAEAGAHLPADTADMRARAGRITDEHDGKPMGLGFDATSGEMPRVGELVVQGGRQRQIENAEGRVTHYRDEQARVDEALQGEEGVGARDRFNDRQPGIVRDEIAKKLTAMAEKISQGEAVPHDNPLYPVAERIARDPDFADPAKRRSIAERELTARQPQEEEIEIHVETEAISEPEGTTPLRKVTPQAREDTTTPTRVKLPEAPAAPAREATPIPREERTTPARKVTPPAKEETPAPAAGVREDTTTPARRVSPAQEEAAAQPKAEAMEETPRDRISGQQARFKTVEMERVEVAGSIAEWIAGGGTKEVPWLQVAWLREQSPETFEAIRKEVVAKVTESKGARVGANADQMMNVFLNNLDFLYRPAMEISPAVTGERYSINGAPEEVGLGRQVLLRGENETLLAQGIERGKGAASGFSSLINVMLEGSIRFGQVGGLVAGDTATFSGGHGPFYVVVERGTLDPAFGGPIGENKHIAYIVPNEQYKTQLAGALSEAVDKGFMTHEEAVAALSKVVTYKEFIDAPKGAFDEPGGVFTAGREKAANDLLGDSTAARKLAGRFDGLVAPFERDSLAMSAIETEPGFGGKNSYDIAMELARRRRAAGKPIAEALPLAAAKPKAKAPPLPEPSEQAAPTRREAGPKAAAQEAVKPEAEETTTPARNAPPAPPEAKAPASAPKSKPSAPKPAAPISHEDRTTTTRAPRREPAPAVEVEDVTTPRAAPPEPQKPARAFGTEAELRALASQDQAERVEAVSKFSVLPRAEQFEVMAQMREKGMGSRADELARNVILDYIIKNETGSHAQVGKEFISLDADKRARIIADLRGMQQHDGATYLNELGILAHGEAGDTLKGVYGISRDEAISIYSGAASLSEAREALAKRMGIELAPFEWANMTARDWVSTPYRGFEKPGDDHFFFGMLLTGDLPGHMNDIGEGMFPGQNAHARIVSSNFRNGAVGAYEIGLEITREVPGPGGTKSYVKERKTVFVKRQDLRPDAAGVEYSLVSGIPAPMIHAATARGDMGYTMHDGTVTRYGVLESMGDYHGTMQVGGREYSTRAAAEMSVGDLASISFLQRQLGATSDATIRAGIEKRLKQYSPEQLELHKYVMDMLASPDPAIRAAFWREFGNVLAGSYAVGLWDRHEVNLRVMRLEIQQPLSAKEAAEFMAQGYTIEHDAASGRTTLFRIGGIDTDAAGSYMASESGGGYLFDNMNYRFGHTDLHRLFESLANATGRDVGSLVSEAFGDVSATRDAGGYTTISGNLTGPIGEGVGRFWAQHGKDPKYRAMIEARFRSHEGEPLGMGYPLGQDDIAGIRSPAKQVEYNAAQSGDPFTQIVSEDGRSENRNYEISPGNTLASMNPGILSMFPPGKEMRVFELRPEKTVTLSTETASRIGWLEYRDENGAVIKVVGVVAGDDPAVAELQAGGIRLLKARRDIPPDKFKAARTELPPETFTHGLIRADEGFSDMTGISVSRAGPVPIFQSLMGAGPEYMAQQFVRIGGWILSKEYEVRPPSAAAPGPAVGGRPRGTQPLPAGQPGGGTAKIATPPPAKAPSAPKAVDIPTSQWLRDADLVSDVPPSQKSQQPKAGGTPRLASEPAMDVRSDELIAPSAPSQRGTATMGPRGTDRMAQAPQGAPAPSEPAMQVRSDELFPASRPGSVSVAEPAAAARADGLAETLKLAEPAGLTAFLKRLYNEDANVRKVAVGELAELRLGNRPAAEVIDGIGSRRANKRAFEMGDAVGIKRFEEHDAVLFSGRIAEAVQQRHAAVAVDVGLQATGSEGAAPTARSAGPAVSRPRPTLRVIEGGLSAPKTTEAPKVSEAPAKVAEAGSAQGQVQVFQYGNGLVALRHGNKVIVLDPNYLIGKHGAGTGTAGSKLGNIASPEQLIALLKEHINPADIGGDSFILANTPAGTTVGTDSMVKILAVRRGGQEILTGTPLEQGVEYTARVRDASGKEFDAPLRMEVTRPASPDGRIGATVQPVIYSDSAPPATESVNIVVRKVDLGDPRAAWADRNGLEQAAGSVTGTDAYAVLTAFPGEYAPPAGDRGVEFDPHVGMTGNEFWTTHALMRKPPGSQGAPPAPAQPPAFEIGPRPQDAKQVKGAGNTPMDAIGMQPNDQYIKDNKLKYNGVFESPGAGRFAEFTFNDLEDQPRVRIGIPDDAALAKSGMSRKQYIEHQLAEARGKAAAGEAAAGAPPKKEPASIAPEAASAKRAEAPSARPGDASESMLNEVVEGRMAGHPGKPREEVAREVHDSLSAESAAIMQKCRPDGKNWVRPTEQKEALIYGLARERAHSMGRTEPAAEDFMFGTIAMGKVDAAIKSQGMEHLRPEILQSLEPILTGVAGEQLPKAINDYLAAAAVICERIPASIINGPEHRAAALSLFGLASYLQRSGAAEPKAIFTNSAKTGVLDLFPVGGPEDLIRLSDAAMVLSDAAQDIVRAKEGGMVEPTMRLILEDASRLDSERRGEYLADVGENFAWSEELGKRISEFDKKSGASARKKRMPILAYLAGPDVAPVIAALDNSVIRNRLSTDTTFRDFIALLGNMRNIRDTPEEKAWLSIVRQNVEYLGIGKGERAKRGIAEDPDASKISFVTDRMRHLNTLIEFYRTGHIARETLGSICAGLDGKMTDKDFNTAVAKGYMRLVPQLRIPEEWVMNNLHIFSEAVSFRQTLEQLGGYIGPFWEYTGKPEAFIEAMGAFNKALLAQVQGRFAEFKFSPEFHRELVETANAAGLDGEMLFNTWKSESAYKVSAAGNEYEVQETGKFDAGFYSGVVRGDTACQDPRNHNPVVGGVLGSIVQPWMRQVAIGPPGSKEATYRRFLNLVVGDDGKPILLLQPAYQTPGTPAEVDQAVVAALRKKYEPLGIEVREMSGAIGKVGDAYDANGRILNRGYRTFTFRAPFAYMDSNMTEITNNGARRMHGLVVGEVGKTVSFPHGQVLSVAR
jgi:hypothetical protein